MKQGTKTANNDTVVVRFYKFMTSNATVNMICKFDG
jgi:hypothetical protein